MLFRDYWEQLKKRNPLLDGEDRLTVEPWKLKALLQQAYEMGEKQARATQKATDGIFDGIFGGKQ